MKRVLFLAMAMISIPALLMADGKKKKVGTEKSPAENTSAISNEKIHWITDINVLQAKMKENPKKVYVDVYTDWCGWCKKMDATTFENPALIKYMNNNFYAVKLDAERKDMINFLGKEYHFEAQYKANTLAVEWMQGKMSYPTAIIMMENFQNPIVQPGYLDVNQLETILTYFGDNAYKHQNGQVYQQNYKPRWNNGQATDATPPAAH